MKNCETEYWIWLQKTLGAGARTDEILSYFESPKELYNAGADEWRLSGLFTPKKFEKLKMYTLADVRETLEECRKKGYKIITPDSADYPERFRNLSDMPLALYGVGDCSVLCDELSIGVVGTRNAGTYGKDVAQKLSFRLADAGATIVSGGALGIDSEAHAGAMMAKGRTLAFLGCGLSFNYLKENEPLRRSIRKYGALVSEYEPFTPAGKATFPIRNRLISGVSLGVLVIEAGIKSGSLITAERALEQGKDVFAVPGDILKSSFDGANFLLKNGAKAVTNPWDILSEYEYTYGDLIDFEKAKLPLSGLEYYDFRKPKNNQSNVRTTVKAEKTEATENAKKGASKKQSIERKPLPKGVSEEADRVYEVITAEPVQIDDIARGSKLSMQSVLCALTELELAGVIKAESGKRYCLK
ncbi:MAG: DNA-processing protein DprA [Acutalibacteraceae bacterium]